MNSISPAELVELSIALGEAAGLQYQYWLATTFATIVASYSAGPTLVLKLKIGIAVMYSLASILFGMIYITNLLRYTEFVQQAIAQGVDLSTPFGWTIGALRLLVWVVGTGLTIWFIFHKKPVQ